MTFKDEGALKMRSVPGTLRPRVHEDAMRIEKALQTRVTPLDTDVMRIEEALQTKVTPSDEDVTRIENVSEVLQLTMMQADTDAMGIGIVSEALLRGTCISALNHAYQPASCRLLDKRIG